MIVGAGHAAGQAAASIRQQGHDGEMLIIGDEPHPPYQRPPLSKQYLSGEQTIERVYLRAKKFYADKNIALRPNTTVDEIDSRAKTVTISTHESINYDKLLIATGSRPRKLDIPGIDLSGIHYYRTIDDVDAVRAEMSPGKKLVIVGGGYIGLEVAAVAVTAGLAVTVLEMEDRILQRVTTPEMSSYYNRVHCAHGVRLVTNARVTHFEGAGSQVARVVCGEVSYEADLVIVGIGIIPNVELAEAAGLEVDNGIIVNDRCETSSPDIYAAGDCTNHLNPHLKRRLRLESVPNAMEQARVAAANIIGGDKIYDAVPWFWSDQYELKLQMVGFSAEADSSIARGDPATDKFAVFYLKQDKIIGVDAVNSAREFMVCKQLFGKRVDPAHLADPQKDLKDLLKA